ncbi:hypothetical protein M2128_002235 [Polynucleobacter sphagniphilus]|jgi:hypothetical protein|uniref:hypothetical protein n=1 Tax=Polynucleobacter sphagniphilus TaxID=1743169 RepID=UPI002474FF3B|nr:hypothetical protein [Polynucleobacter sphagniphilus]MDH6303289.1 hypothetical protein [Polynucleobacter sphagniphilus]
MLVELITPLMIATAPAIVDAKAPVYSHSTQQVIALNDISGQTPAAFGSTRTYDISGKPWDNDND